MFHFIKYLFLVVFLFGVLGLFLSNMETSVNLRFNIPFIWEWRSPAISLNFLLLISFCVGILFSAFAGALRFAAVRAQKRQLKDIKKEVEELQKVHSTVTREPVISPKSDTLPSLADN